MKKKKKSYSEIDIVIHAHSETMGKVKEIAGQIIEKYNGNITEKLAIESAKEYYLFSILPMAVNPEIREAAIKSLDSYHKQRSARLNKEKV